MVRVAPSSVATESRSSLTSATMISLAPAALGDLHGHEPDRSGAGDEDPRRRCRPALAAGPDADREGFEEGGGLVEYGVGDRVGEGVVDHHELGERAVDRWCGVEPHVGAEVVAPGEALLAGAAGDTGLDRDALPDAAGVDICPDGLDDPGRLVAKDER